jgi:excinuclease UvrABC ATPase subunit
MNLKELEDWLKDTKSKNKIFNLLHQLMEVGLVHLRLDQPVQSLSSGERQRLLLLNWIEEQASGALFILDEPSIGLHYADIDMMFAMLERLSAQNDVLVIDHNPYLLKKIGVGLKLE